MDSPSLFYEGALIGKVVELKFTEHVNRSGGGE